jgi:hypothetical protein
MSSDRRLIQNRKVLLAILAFCAYEIVATWRGMDKPSPATYDVVTILGGLFVTLICSLVVARTTFIGDRVVVGPIAVASFLWIVLRLLLPNQQVMHTMREAVWLMWLTSLVAGIIILVRYPKGWPRLET